MLAALIAGALVGLTGCGGGGGGGSSVAVAVPDTTAPTVTSMTPGEDTSELAINSSITITFSEAMLPGEITTDTFRVTDGITAIPGGVTFDTTNHIAMFVPDGELAPNTRYTATIVTGIGDLAGNPLTTDFAWCFVTAGAAASNSPAVTATRPTDGTANVATNQRISASFGADLNSATLSPASFRVTAAGGSPVAGTVTYLRRTAVFMPSHALAPNTAYIATISTAVTDLAGSASLADLTWGFTTGGSPDATPPVVLATSPASAGLDVAISGTIQAAFSEPMDPATLTTETFTVTGPGAAPVIGTVALDATSKTATFTRINHLTTPVTFHVTPVSNFDAATTYTATLTAGARDMAGNALASNVVWSFTTAP